MLNIPLPGQIYKHFKGNLYRIITLAEHSETGEKLVIYQALYGDYQVYARPLSMFMEKVDREKYPNAVSEYRFELQKELIEMPVLGKPEEALETPAQAGASSEETAKIPLQELEEKSKPLAQKTSETTENPSIEPTPAEPSPEEFTLDPLVMEFLDADTCEKRLNILSALHDRITDDMINIMAVCAGVEIEEGDTERRFEELRACLVTLGRYEGTRLR
ncbi:MAG: DUF1653 domain-containing protein [Clostridium sp.]|nr:DUF1653 domain-containing protein [Clostridium sp.]